MAAQVARSGTSMADAGFLRRVNVLRTVDHFTNWYHLVREYIFLALVLGLMVWLYESTWNGAVSWIWAIPATLLSNICVGAGQHRLATLTHEAAHYMLFKNRLVNEIVSEWFCMFPILGTTHSYRVQHLGHHQHPNDPDKDPDWTQLSLSGHKFAFPMSRRRFLWECVIKQIVWPPALLRYVLVRAFFKVDNRDTPYRMHRRTSPKLLLTGLAYHLILVGGMTACVGFESTAGLWLFAAGMLAGAFVLYTVLPDRWFADYFIKPDLTVRTTARMRLVFNTSVIAGVAYSTLATERPVWLWFFILWMIPLGSSFALFMVLRQLVQHGNADRGRFTNTRVFRVHPLLHFSIFPIGNDDHLPHHLFPLVPHYNLKKLHALLMETSEYREGVTLVQGYFVSPEPPPREHPTVLDLMTH